MYREKHKTYSIMKALDFLAIVAKYNVPNSYYTVFEEGGTRLREVVRVGRIPCQGGCGENSRRHCRSSRIQRGIGKRTNRIPYRKGTHS